MKYCYNCGSPLKETLVGAEKIKRYYGLDMTCPESPYDEKTGARKYAMKFICPNKKWYNNCASYIEDKIIK